MQYVRNLSDSVSTAWNSINPATLSGAIDVIVVEQDDGTLSCSPFHVRFGKFSLLRPYEKKVEFKVNGSKQNYAMKLGEGGEAFFVFETTDTIPQSMQTSPLVSPAGSPTFQPARPASMLQEPESFDLNDEDLSKPRSASFHRPPPTALYTVPGRDGYLTPRSTSPELFRGQPRDGDWSAQRPYSDDILRKTARAQSLEPDTGAVDQDTPGTERSLSPPPLMRSEALQRAMTISKELSAVNIPTHVTEAGDLMLDMTGYKNNEEDAIRAEVLARKVLTEELEGNYDVGALFGMDEHGNLWIYNSEEAKDAAMRKTVEASIRANPALAIDAVSDPGYNSDSSDATSQPTFQGHRRSESDVGQMSLQTPPSSPGTPIVGHPNKNYAKTLRLTSDQLKSLQLKPGGNSMSFTVNRATCSANMYLWRADVPVVISDIDGTITKSDALGQVLNMIGRDWTHAGVAKLYSDIVANGYNIMYLTSRSVGLADTTRAYLAGISQHGYRIPPGPTILSPDRTMAALRREIYLRKPHIFKMATLRDIRNLYGPDRSPFYAGFGNRFTDQISYRTVDVPRNRIFTINSNAEVSMDLLSLNKMKLSYVNINEVVDHYFPPVSTLVKGGGEEYTDFRYWRDQPLELEDFSASESDAEEDEEDEDEEEDEEAGDALGDSYISRASMDDLSADEYGEGSILSGDYEGEENMMHSVLEYAEQDDAEGEGDDAEDEDADDEQDGGELEEEQTRLASALDKAEARSKSSLSQKPEEDLTAELVTGVNNLTVDK